MLKKKASALLTHPLSWIIVILLLVTAVMIVMAFRFSLHKTLSENADSIGSSIGAVPGKAVGMAVGSYEGWEVGKKEATEHPEVTVDIKSRLNEVGKLEVLKVSAKEDNFMTEKDLAKCQIVVVDVVYSIDLQKATFEETADELLVTLPHPECDTYFNESKTKTLFETSSSFWSNGSAQYGWESGINVRKKLREKTEDKFKKDEEIVKKAERAGEQEVKNFVSSIRLDKSKPVIVRYAEGG